MSQDISWSLAPPPWTLQDCLVDGHVDVARYYYYSRRYEYHNSSFRDIISKGQKKRKYGDNGCVPKKKRYRPVKRHKLLVRDKNGSLREILPTDTLWYLLYVQPPMNDMMSASFRHRLRLPYCSFLSISEDISNHYQFSRWTRCDTIGASPCDMKLPLLGSLRYMGRA